MIPDYSKHKISLNLIYYDRDQKPESETMDPVPVQSYKLEKDFSVNSRRYRITSLMTQVYCVLICGFLIGFSNVSGTITVISTITNDSVLEINDEPARYVPDRVSFYGTQGYAVYANPANACSAVQPPPETAEAVNFILVARRFDCNFQEKIQNAQAAGYTGIIIHNVGSNSTAPIYVEQPGKLSIYACFIGEYYGQLLRDKFNFTSGYYIRIEDDFSLNGYFLPFAIVVGVCFAVMLLFMLWQQVTRWTRERRRARRLKLPSSALKKLPVTKWTKGDPYETCAVCLEDFIEQDKVRVLPCSHGFHTVCIDPWLTKGRRVCPICKRKVILADERFPDSDSDTEDESAPLLRAGASTSAAASAVTSGSTFVQQQENPFRRAQRRAQRRQRHRAQPGRAASVDSDDTSSTGSSDSQGSRSHRSLPVLAEVHGANLGQSSTEVPPGSRAPFPSLQTRPSSIFNSRSSSYRDGDAIVVNVVQMEPETTDQSSTGGGGDISVKTGSDDADIDVRFEGASQALEIAESENSSLQPDNVSSSSNTSSTSNRNAIV